MAGIKIALVATVLSGCATTQPPHRVPPPKSLPAGPSAPAAAPPASAPTAPAARVVLTRSGGFAGRGDTVTVEPDGRWSVVDRAGSRRTGRLSGADLDRLRRLVADPALAAEAGRASAPTACHDAFDYRLTVGAVETGYVDCPSDAAPPETTRAVAELLLTATA
ncbi:protealysin inhibitor emfourin [Micromonospora sp. NPDC047812]|uniref:protealysin inhibitor emfourin n=1 Tax=Micromonospora sp. NPDC047812 TaxID=3155742 RepID=UPI003455D838